MNTFASDNNNDNNDYDDKSVRAKLLEEYSVSEELVKSLEPLQAKDLLEHIEILVNKHEKRMWGKV